MKPCIQQKKKGEMKFLSIQVNCGFSLKKSTIKETPNVSPLKSKDSFVISNNNCHTYDTYILRVPLHLSSVIPDPL